LAPPLILYVIVICNVCGLVKVISGSGRDPWQTVVVPLMVAVGAGRTTTVAVIGLPGQPFAVGVMVKVTVMGALVKLVNVPLIFPEPLAAIPVTVTVLFLVQLKVTPVVVLESTIAVIVVAEQLVWEAGVAIAMGVGFTRTVAVIGAPEQPFDVGVIVNVNVIGATVVLTKAPLISPEPLAAIPVIETVLSLVQLKVTPEVVLESTIVVIVAAEQMVWADGVAMATGVGFTSTVAVIGAPGQPFAVGIIVNVTVSGAAVVFVKVPLISPEPLAAMPVTVILLSLVQEYEVPVVVLESTIVVIVATEQMVCEAGVATATGVGFTRTVAVIGVPGQPFDVGVMINVTVIGATVVFVKAPLISPEPLAAIPVIVTVLFLVQLKVTPVVVLESTIVVIVAAEQMVWADGVATATGVGFTSMVAVIGVPGQPFAVGVIVNVTVTGALVIFVKTPLMFPEPLAAIPVTVALLSLVQLKVTPEVVLERAIVVIVAEEHIVCEDGVATTTGVGFTSTVAIIGAPGQPFAVGVMVNVTVIGALVVFVKAPLISPAPLAGIPVTERTLSLVQLNVVPEVLPERTMVVMVAAEQMV
jgi:hypothetical protein